MNHWTRVGPSHYQGGGFDLERVGPYGSKRQWRLEGRGRTTYHQSINGARREAKRHGVTNEMRSTRRRRRKNPTASTVLLVGGALAAVGIGLYFLLKPSTTTASTATTATAPATPGGSVVVYTDPQGKTYTRDYAAQIACQLKKLGQTNESNYWGNLVTSNGGALLC